MGKKIILSCIIFFLTLSLIEWDFFRKNSAILQMNLTRNVSYVTTDMLWVARYNEAIWKTEQHDFSGAKLLLTGLLNTADVPKKSEILELYGDVLFTLSGSLDDILTLYDHALSISYTPRVQEKRNRIEAQKKKEYKGSGSQQREEKAFSGSEAIDEKRKELEKVSNEKKMFLSSSSLDISKSELEKLVESIQNGTVISGQDW